MSIRLGETAPDFKVDTTKGAISFHEWAGDSWVFFFSHPADFTPVCTTEMGRTAQLAQEFAARNVKPLGLSTDSVDEHMKWIDDVNDTQSCDLQFPIVADEDHNIAQLYAMIHPGESETAAVRGVFAREPAMKVRQTLTYPMAVRRHFREVVRDIAAVQTADGSEVALPADGRKGGDVIIPAPISNEEAKDIFPQGWSELRPYLR